MKTKLNVKLLRKVQAHILEEPKRFIMNDVAVSDAPGRMYYEDGIKRPFASCGTMACVAGWACLLSNRPAYMDEAEKLLGLTPTQGDALFLEGYWPDKYRAAWKAAKTPVGRARAAVRRIDHYIKTKGAE